MYNWSGTDPQKFKTQTQKDIWELEQLINFGLNGEKISRNKLVKYWDQLKIDVKRKNYLAFLLWNSKNYQQPSKSL